MTTHTWAGDQFPVPVRGPVPPEVCWDLAETLGHHSLSDASIKPWGSGIHGRPCDWWFLVRLISIESRKGMIYCLLDPHWAGLRALLHQSVGWVPCLRPSVLFLKDRWYSSAAPPYLQILNIFLCRLIEKYSINIFRRSVINNIWIEKIGHPATVLKKGCPFFTFTAVKLECASKNSFVLI